MTEGFPVIPVRWQRDQPRHTATRELAATHPLVGTPCPVCAEGLSGDVALMAVGPLDEDDDERHEMGRWYSAGGVAVHEHCAPAFDPAALDADRGGS